jgi:U3 small nucleolar RNA-associated protein 13
VALHPAQSVLWRSLTDQLCVSHAMQGHKGPIADVAVDSSGGLLATASADRSVRVWDVDGGFCTHAFTGHR